MTTSPLDLPTPASLDPDTARRAVGGLSVALGAAAVLAPRRTATLLGVRATGPSGPLLVRMVGVRNATMGLRALRATEDERRRSVQAGLAVGAVDVLAVLAAWRSGALTPKAALALLALLGAIAYLGLVAQQG